jgi:hypothetical protein
MLVRELITNSWYLSGIVGRELQVVDGSQITDGLELLNGFLAEKSATGDAIPYYSHYAQIPITGQESYFIPNLISIDEITFFMGPVRFPMYRQTRYEYWGTGRVNNINSLPYSYYAEKALGGTKIYVYFSPNPSIDSFQITGRFALSSLELDDVVEEFIDNYYRQYVFYSLARRLCDWYGHSWDPQKEFTRLQLERSVTNVNPIDMTRTTINPLRKLSNFSYVDANLGKGWQPL